MSDKAEGRAHKKWSRFPAPPQFAVLWVLRVVNFPASNSLGTRYYHSNWRPLSLVGPINSKTGVGKKGSLHLSFGFHTLCYQMVEFVGRYVWRHLSSWNVVKVNVNLGKNIKLDRVVVSVNLIFGCIGAASNRKLDGLWFLVVKWS